MDHLAVSQKRDCWICYNNTNLTILNSEKIFQICGRYLNPSIIIESFENEAPIPCCNYCYETAVELILLEKQIERLKKEISELSSLFLERVLKQRNKRGSIVSSSKCQGSTEIGDPVYDVGLDVGDQVKENIIHSEDEIEVKYSYDETVPKVISTFCESITPNQQLSKTNTTKEDSQQTIKTSMTDLLKCLKMPIIQLERLQFCKGRKPKDVVDKSSSDFDSEIIDPEKSSSLSIAPSENILAPELNVLPKNPENCVLIYAQPLNASVITSEETLKCKNDIEENQPFKCSICGQGFTKRCQLEDHDKLHNKVAQYSCSICDKSFPDPSVLKLHENFHTAKRPFNFYFSSKSVRKRVGNLRTHKISESEAKPFKCSICSKSFGRSSNLNRHKMLHSQNRPVRSFKCSLCPKSFKSLANLKTHEKIHTGIRPFKCSSCAKSFRSLCELKQHDTIHTGNKPYKCAFCPKSYLSFNNLKQHETFHTGERPLKCGFCSKYFRSILGLKQHELIHTGKGSFKCSSCSKSFICALKLKQHETIHTEEKPFKCSICPKSLKTLLGLKRHEARHTGERPHICSFCPKSYGSEDLLKQHGIIHTGERPFKCSSCEKTFRQKISLKRHCESRHRNATEEFILP